jgi:uncharacterized membrane protein HdeD (DUF308 family)
MNERTKRQINADTMQAPHQRLWWMEFTRGLIACAFGLLFLAARSFAPRLFMYSLGTYLVVDGVLELVDAHRKKGLSRLTPLDWAGGALSLLAGLVMLAFPTITLFFVADLLAVRLFIRSLSQVRAARHARGSHAFLLWASCGFFVLPGLFLLLLPQLAITALVVFLGGYMLAAGLFFLLRGLSLRFQHKGLPRSPGHPPQAPPGLCAGLSPSTRRAVAFVRRAAADGLGHIAWGFEWANGWFNVGSVENLKSKPFADPQDMDFWSTHTVDPVATMQEREYPYDEYKLFFVEQPHPKEAWKTVIWESREPYSFVHHNCCDVTYEILRAYGYAGLLDPAKEYIPNDWYDALPGASYAIATYPAIAVSLHRQSRRPLAMREITLAIPARVKGLPPPWLEHRWRAWEELTLVWEMMVGHVLALWTSGIKLIAQHWRSRATHP